MQSRLTCDSSYNRGAPFPANAASQLTLALERSQRRCAPRAPFNITPHHPSRMPYAPCSAHAPMSTHVVTFLSRCPGHAFTHFSCSSTARRRSLRARSSLPKAERRVRSTRSRTCRTSPARTPDERSREPNERLEVGESDSTFNVCYQLDYDALATRYTQHLRPLRRAAAAATAPRRGASSFARASRPGANARLCDVGLQKTLRLPKTRFDHKPSTFSA